MFKPARKQFGQNFLHDGNIISRIVDSIHPEESDHIIEIGPGRGALTNELLKKTKHMHAIEIDRDLADWWQSQNIPNLTLHNEDALKVNICELIDTGDEKIRLVGNLPYNISTPLLFHLFGHQHCISDMHFMLQKEVVDRICAGPGSKLYGRLSVMAQYYCQCTALFNVSPHCFKPAPKVDSAVIRLVPHEKVPVDVDASLLATVVKQAFSMRRKTIRNGLKKWLTSEQISALGIDPQYRPEQLSLSDFATLARHCTTKAE